MVTGRGQVQARLQPVHPDAEFQENETQKSGKDFAVLLVNISLLFVYASVVKEILIEGSVNQADVFRWMLAL